jgi:hypothetical protein
MTLTINMISFRIRANIPCWIYPIRALESIITKILVSHICKNKIMSDEHMVSLQNSMQLLPTRLPILVLQRVEK